MKMNDPMTIPHPFFVVDSGVQGFIDEQPWKTLATRRDQRTTGSVQYVLHWPRSGEVATIHLRACTQNTTRLGWMWNERRIPTTIRARAQVEQQMRFLLTDLVSWIIAEATEGINIQTPVATFDEARLEIVFPLSVGRRGSPMNDWAREEIAKGRSPKDVFQDYLQQTGDLDVERAWDRFRMAVRRKRRS